MEKEAKTCLKGPIAYYIGLFFFYLGFATAGPVGSLAIYMISYYCLKDSSITMNYAFFLHPIMTLCSTLSKPISGFLEKNRFPFDYINFCNYNICSSSS